MKKKRILLAMSGGVDSSVSAILLKKEGYEVIGLTFRIWKETDSFATNNEPDYITDARKVSEKVGITHFTLDIRTEFKETVVEYFIHEYLEGRTPFPCAICNPQIKWKFLLEKAIELKCDFIATGHYVRIKKINGQTFIYKAIDQEKDQSFFLWTLKENVLAKAVFPLGNLTKSEVRNIALENDLSIIEHKKESTGICFLKNPDYRVFIEKVIKEKNLPITEGSFISKDGIHLGNHKGYPFFTVGQRRGLGIHFNKAYYVNKINPDKNQVVLTDKKDLFLDRISLVNTIFLIDDNELLKNDYIVKIRYRKQENLSKISKNSEGNYFVDLYEKLDMIAPGQTAVLYHKERVIGGGFIN